MKKVSTAVTMQSRNISQQKLTIGLDLGDRNSWYCVLDETGQIQREQRVRTNDGSTPQWLRALATEGVPSINVGSPGCASA
jgi:predicted NBD/HSP70 family sugar kinase